MRHLLLAFCLLAALSSAAPADPALTADASVMRAAPSVQAHIVQRAPARAEIDLSNCSQDWCYVSWRNMFGYLPAAVVSAQPYGPPGYGPPPPAIAGGGWGAPLRIWLVPTLVRRCVL
jgi:hypothetical protein